jgi:hypothetical protein
MSNDNDFAAVSNTNHITVEIEDIASSTARKQVERDELDQQVNEFLSSGGEINVVGPNVLADPPKKPTSNYGSQPI